MKLGEADLGPAAFDPAGVFSVDFGRQLRGGPKFSPRGSTEKRVQGQDLSEEPMQVGLPVHGI